MPPPSPPIQLVVMIFVRKCLDFVFTKDELRVLDAVLPPFRCKKTPAIGRPADDSESSANGKSSRDGMPKNPSRVNISDEVTKSTVWKNVNENKTPRTFVFF